MVNGAPCSDLFCVAWNRTLDAGEMTGFELASVANLQPESAEEAKILIPSLDVSLPTTYQGSKILLASGTS